MESSKKPSCSCFGFFNKKASKKVDIGIGPEVAERIEGPFAPPGAEGSQDNFYFSYSMGSTQKLVSRFPMMNTMSTPQLKTPQIYDFFGTGELEKGSVAKGEQKSLEFAGPQPMIQRKNSMPNYFIEERSNENFKNEEAKGQSIVSNEEVKAKVADIKKESIVSTETSLIVSKEMASNAGVSDSELSSRLSGMMSKQRSGDDQVRIAGRRVEEKKTSGIFDLKLPEIKENDGKLEMTPTVQVIVQESCVFNRLSDLEKQDIMIPGVIDEKEPMKEPTITKIEVTRDQELQSNKNEIVLKPYLENIFKIQEDLFPKEKNNYELTTKRSLPTLELEALNGPQIIPERHESPKKSLPSNPGLISPRSAYLKLNTEKPERQYRSNHASVEKSKPMLIPRNLPINSAIRSKFPEKQLTPRDHLSNPLIKPSKSEEVLKKLQPKLIKTKKTNKAVNMPYQSSQLPVSLVPAHIPQAKLLPSPLEFSKQSQKKIYNKPICIKTISPSPIISNKVIETKDPPSIVAKPIVPSLDFNSQEKDAPEWIFDKLLLPKMSIDKQEAIKIEKNEIGKIENAILTEISSLSHSRSMSHTNTVIIHENIKLSKAASLINKDFELFFLEKADQKMEFSPRFEMRRLPSLKISPIKSNFSVDEYSDIMSFIVSSPNSSSASRKLDVENDLGKPYKLPALKPITPHYFHKKRCAPQPKDKKLLIENL